MRATEERMVIENLTEEQFDNDYDVLRANRKIPYNLLKINFDDTATDLFNELDNIYRFYKIYEKGAKFIVEGTSGDYVAANLKCMMAASLINKEARFLFAESPSITIKAKGDVGKISKEAEDNLTTLNDLVTTVLSRNKFDNILLKAAKDCFIGKRIAYLVNFNSDDGITISFIPSTQFFYKYKDANINELESFVCVMPLNSETRQSEKKLFRKKYEKVEGKVYLEEAIYSGAGALIEEVTQRQELAIDFIPAGVILNDGLTGDIYGISEVQMLRSFESWYSKLSNADMDADRKSMNPIRYTVDMEGNSTKNLSSSAGSFWDLQSDQNLDKSNPQVGLLESSMGYSATLESTLKRIKANGYEMVDVPDINLETMSGVITSGKALKAIYWPLIVRCKEKMKEWGPALENLVRIIVDGSMVYGDIASRYITDTISPVDYKVSIKQNTPIPEDEVEEKNMDISEVESKLMSRKTYMKKWRGLTDDEVDKELEQIALERQMLEDAAFNMPVEETEPYPTDEEINNQII